MIFEALMFQVCNFEFSVAREKLKLTKQIKLNNTLLKYLAVYIIVKR